MYDSYGITSRSNRFYISNQELTVGIAAVLATAVQAGPAALMAAWTSITVALAGPLGAVVSFTVSALGTGFFTVLCYKVAGAILEGKGLAFYVGWDVPPVSVEIE